MTGLSKPVTFSCNRGPRIKRKVGGKVRTKYIHIPLCFDGDRERSRVDPVNFMDDPVIGQSRVIYIVSIPCDCCWQGMEICRWSVCRDTCGFFSVFLSHAVYGSSYENVSVLKNGKATSLKRCEVYIRHKWHRRAYLF